MLRLRRLPNTRLRLPRLLNAPAVVSRRWATTDALSPQDASPSLRSQSSVSEGWLFVDSVLPIMLGAWDFRHYVAYLREDYLLSRIETLFQSVKTSGFRVLSVESRTKDGGVFVKFNYEPGEDEQKTLHNILKTLQDEAEEQGGIPTWLGVRPQAGHIWLVKGKPWREDLNRFSSPMLKVAFDGPDIREDDLYNILRPYGRIMEITNPVPVPSGTLRSSTVTFRQLRSSVTAHNCIHSLSVPSTGSSNAWTRLHTTFERPIKAHVIRDWISGHPRIVIPILVFLLGSITYTIFDPIRAFAVEGKLLDWFDYRKSNIYKWIRENTWERFSFGTRSDGGLAPSHGVWRDRKDAEAGIETYLRDYPGTLTFVHGPQGSGKSRMLSAVLKDNERPVLVIDCAELYKASSESVMLLSLARQTGYWPIFPFVNSLNNLIDVASMGLIGQKAGLSSSMENQVKEMLEVVGTGLRNVRSRQAKKLENIAQETEACDREKTFHSGREAAIRLGIWHDGRLDCVAGNGIMCELGIGDEYMGEMDYDPVSSPGSTFEKLAFSGYPEGKGRENNVIKGPTSVETLPIVIIKNFATKRGRDEVLTVMANWAASLVNNQVAHVIVVSDNRENAKILAQALPSKPLNSIPLDDADSEGALSFVSEKLREGGEAKELTPELTKYIERLGGRASDLETMVHKVLNGQTVEGAIEDIITRGVNELRKNGFGDDIEDAKSLPWTREQAWTIVKLLSKQDEIPYHDVLLDFPFKGDENALRNMEHAELISIGTNQGRPSVIKPGRPIYRYVFERLVADPIFRAVSEIAVHEKLIASAESTIRACEEELSKLNELGGVNSTNWWSSSNGMNARSAYLIKKMDAAVDKLIKLEAKNAELKKVLAKGG